MKKIFLVILGIFGFFSMLSMAETGSENSPAIQTYFGQQKKMGDGTVYKLIFPAYDISLWVKGTTWSYDVPFALEVMARWDCPKTEMLESTIEVMKRNTKLTDAQAKDYETFLNSFYPNLKNRDLVTVVYKPNEAILFYHNNKLLRESRDMTFARAFCDIWLSPNTKYDSAREGMLGLK